MIADMTIVTATDFRNNMTHYMELANSGERVELSSRSGRFLLTPAKKRNAAKTARPKRDVTAEIVEGMRDWKEFLDMGKTDKFLPAAELTDELRNI